jgi:hypothetical protein
VAEKTVIVCDVCGEIATERVTIKTGDRTLQKDLCAAHLAELVAGARPAKRGRRPTLGKPTASKPTRTRTQKSASKRTTRSRRTRKAPAASS